MQIPLNKPMQRPGQAGPGQAFHRAVQPVQHSVQHLQPRNQPKSIVSPAVSFPYSRYSPFILRVTIGLMFVVTGIIKIRVPEGIISVIEGLGFPLASFFGWILILSEIIFGIALIIGFKTKYAVWPLVAILSVALFRVYIAQFSFSNPSSVIMFMFHLITAAALISIFLTGSGKYSWKI